MIIDDARSVAAIICSTLQTSTVFVLCQTLYWPPLFAFLSSGAVAFHPMYRLKVDWIHPCPRVLRLVLDTLGQSKKRDTAIVTIFNQKNITFCVLAHVKSQIFTCWTCRVGFFWQAPEDSKARPMKSRAINRLAICFCIKYSTSPVGRYSWLPFDALSSL